MTFPVHTSLLARFNGVALTDGTTLLAVTAAITHALRSSVQDSWGGERRAALPGLA